MDTKLRLSVYDDQDVQNVAFKISVVCTPLFFEAWLIFPKREINQVNTKSPARPTPSCHLLVQRQQRKYQKTGWNLFAINNKETNSMSAILLSCFYCWLQRDLTHCSGVPIVDFGQLNASWVITVITCKQFRYIFLDIFLL